MASSTRRNLVSALGVLLLAASVGLAGCGRRGPLEPPSAAVTTPTPATATTQSTGSSTTATPDQTPPKPDKPFFLDPLLR